MMNDEWTDQLVWDQLKWHSNDVMHDDNNDDINDYTVNCDNNDKRHSGKDDNNNSDVA